MKLGHLSNFLTSDFVNQNIVTDISDDHDKQWFPNLIRFKAVDSENLMIFFNADATIHSVVVKGHFIWRTDKRAPINAAFLQEYFLTLHEILTACDYKE